MNPFFNPGPSEEARPPVFISAGNPYNCRVAGEVCDGVSLHPLCSPEYLKQVILPNIAAGAAKAGRDSSSVNVNASSFVITGPSKASIDENKDAVRRRIAFYSSTRSYSKVLAIHGFDDVSVRLHEMSLKGLWDDMTGLITDEILEAFAVIGGYDEIAPMLHERYDGLVDEMVFGRESSELTDENQLRRIIRDLQT